MFSVRLLKFGTVITLFFFIWVVTAADFTFAEIRVPSVESPQKVKKTETPAEQVKTGAGDEKKKESECRTNIILKEGKKKKLRWWYFAIGAAAVALGIILYFIFKPDEPYDTKVLGIEWVEISKGTFTMGADNGNNNEKPAHSVSLDRYRISKYEITFAQYKKFCEDDKRTIPSDEGWGGGQHPVIHVSWEDARDFCVWLSGKADKNIALPTEAQWEKAARGTHQHTYPWGNNPPTCSLANYDACNLEETVEVGMRPDGRSPYQVHDMAGNVWEWCKDLYDPDYYSDPASYDNPQGPTTGGSRVIKGGGFSSSAHVIRCSERDSYDPKTEKKNIGFRICWND